MQFNKIITPVLPKVMAVLILYIVLWVVHGWCEPLALTGGATLPDGSIGGGVSQHCGAFSMYLWNHLAAYDFYTRLNGWWLFAVALVLVFLCSLAIELFRSRSDSKGLQ